MTQKSEVQPNSQAQTEIERYKAEREKTFKDNETKNVGCKEDIAAKIEADTKVKIEAMNRSVASNREAVIQSILSLCCDIKPVVISHKFLKLQQLIVLYQQVHKNYRPAPGV